MKELFKIYLSKYVKKNNGVEYSNPTINYYASSIITASNLLSKKLYLLDESELEILPSLNLQLGKGEEKEEIGNCNNGGVRASLKLYENFRIHLKENPEIYKSQKKTKNEELIEETLETNFHQMPFFKDYKIVKRQFKSGNFKYDLLLEHTKKDEFAIVELKDTPIFSSSIAQIADYMNDFKKKNDKKIKGIIIGHYLTDSAKEFFNNIVNYDIEFLKFNLNINVEEIKI